MNKGFPPGALLACLVSAIAADARAQVTAADPPTLPPPGAASVSEIVVTARRLNEARAAIQPSLGASVYTITQAAIEAMPGGSNVSLNQVVLQSPGVAQDSFGQLHVRGEHNGLQFRLNGVILPEGLSVFSQALSPRLAKSVELITGALPAQYGLRTGGIVDIATKDGLQGAGGSVSMYGGAHDELQPSFEFGAGSGGFNAFVSGSYRHSALGIESPDGSSTPLHDVTDQYSLFAYAEDVISPSDKVSAIVGASDQRFQIPNRAGQTPSILLGPNMDQPLVVNGVSTFDSANLNESQKEATYYGVVSLLHDSGPLTAQISLFGRYSDLRFTPDDLGDLLFNGISQRAYKKDIAGGLQAESVFRAGAGHTIRAGLIAEVDRSSSEAVSQVIGLLPDGSQASQTPLVIPDAGSRTATTFSVYAQDEWKLLSDVTFNYGLRFDQFDGFRRENQLSPRANLVWTPPTGTTVHVGYARYFSPPPFELVGTETVTRFANTTAASPTSLDVTPYAERANYLDFGISQRVARGLTAAVDSYYKTSRNLVDEGQFGAPIILTPFNYAEGRQYGLELTTNYVRGAFTAYANLALERSEGKDINSSQFNFTQADLDYIRDHFIYLDHDQTYTASAGASYGYRGTKVSGDLIFGSGLRATLPGGAPNGAHLPAYTTVNFSLSHSFDAGPLRQIEARLDLVNAFDRVYEIRDGTGVGVGAPQYGARRGLFAGVTKSF